MLNIIRKIISCENVKCGWHDRMKVATQGAFVRNHDKQFYNLQELFEDLCFFIFFKDFWAIFLVFGIHQHNECDKLILPRKGLFNPKLPTILFQGCVLCASSYEA